MYAAQCSSRVVTISKLNHRDFATQDIALNDLDELTHYNEHITSIASHQSYTEPSSANVPRSRKVENLYIREWRINPCTWLRPIDLGGLHSYMSIRAPVKVDDYSGHVYSGFAKLMHIWMTNSTQNTTAIILSTPPDHIRSIGDTQVCSPVSTRTEDIEAGCKITPPIIVKRCRTASRSSYWNRSTAL